MYGMVVAVVRSLPLSVAIASPVRCRLLNLACLLQVAAYACFSSS